MGRSSPSSPRTTSVSSKPKASFRNRSSASASLHVRAGQTVGVLVVVVVSLMSSSSAWSSLAVLHGWELVGDPFGRRTAGQVVPLPGEVGLVVVAAGGGDGGQPGPSRHRQQVARPLEAQDPG